MKPTIRTEYYVEFGSLISRSAPIVYVRPKLTLRVRNGRFVAAAGPSSVYGRKLVHLQRRIGNKWRTIDVVRTGRNGVVRFRSAVPSGRQVLRLMTRPAPGYLVGYSNRLTYRS